MRCGSQPKIPTQRVRDRCFTLRTTDPLRPDWPVGPAVYFTDVTQRSGGHPLVDQSSPFACMPLIAHLGNDIICLSGPCQHATLIDGMTEWLLNIDMFSHTDRMHRDGCMHVVGRTDKDCVNFRFTVEHLTIIPIGFCFIPKRGCKILLQRVREPAIIDIANRIDIFVGHTLNIRTALPGRADSRNIQAVTGCNVVLPSEYGSRHNHECRRRGGTFHETSSGFGFRQLRPGGLLFHFWTPSGLAQEQQTTRAEKFGTARLLIKTVRISTHGAVVHVSKIPQLQTVSQVTVRNTQALPAASQILLLNGQATEKHPLCVPQQPA